MTLAEQTGELAYRLIGAKHQGANLAHRALLGVEPEELWGRSLELARELEALHELAQELELQYREQVVAPLADELGLGLQTLLGGEP
jgi:hypothetical protein